MQQDVLVHTSRNGNTLPRGEVTISQCFVEASFATSIQGGKNGLAVFPAPPPARTRLQRGKSRSSPMRDSSEPIYTCHIQQKHHRTVPVLPISPWRADWYVGAFYYSVYGTTAAVVRAIFVHLAANEIESSSTLPPPPLPAIKQLVHRGEISAQDATLDAQISINTLQALRTHRKPSDAHPFGLPTAWHC